MRKCLRAATVVSIYHKEKWVPCAKTSHFIRVFRIDPRLAGNSGCEPFHMLEESICFWC
jgi:hypothetical protein